MSEVRVEVDSSCSPRITKRHVERVLSWLPKRDLHGLEVVRVIEDAPDDELDGANVPAYMRGFLYNGQYASRTKNRPAQILLYANDVYFGIPKIFLGSRMATLKVARTLAHEVAHHVIAARGYIYDSSEKYKSWKGVRDPAEEDMAHRYASDVVERMKSYWPYMVGNSLARMLSYSFYKAGLQDYWDENHKEAAARQAKPHSLNPQNEDAGQCFRHAIEKLKSQSPSPLSEAEREWLFKKYSPRPLNAGRKPYFRE
jgi:predicted Zn-dependent protease with MMP-like domain